MGIYYREHVSDSIAETLPPTKKECVFTKWCLAEGEQLAVGVVPVQATEGNYG